MLSSKKFLGFLASVVVVIALKVAGKLGIALDAATAGEIADAVVKLGIAYVVGQGIADHGKEAARVNASAESETAAAEPPKP